METKRTRRTFDPAFKVQAARRVVDGKEKAAVVAAELGINVVSLYQWIKEFEKKQTISGTATESQPNLAVSSDKEIIRETEPLVQVETVTSAPKETPAPALETAPAPVRNIIKLRPKKTHPVPDSQPANPVAVSAGAANETQTEPAPQVASPSPVAEIEATPAEETTVTRNERPSKFGRNRDRRKERQEKQDRRFSGPNTNNYQNNAPHQTSNYENNEADSGTIPEVQDEPESRWPEPTAAQGRRWKVMHALEQRPNYKEESEHYGYVDEFDLPAQNLPEVWEILNQMQKVADRRAFDEMVREKDLNVPIEVLNDPRLMTIQGPNVPNKPWLRKARLNPVAEEFFQTTPDYLKSVYEIYGGLTIRLDKNSKGTPILLIENAPEGGRNITISFSKFDRFVDDFYGEFVRECKTVMMKQNPKEYPGLNAFIRIPDEPIWNPKLWAGIRTFHWRDGESLAEAWIRYAQAMKRNNRNNKRFVAEY